MPVIARIDADPSRSVRDLGGRSLNQLAR